MSAVDVSPLFVLDAKSLWASLRLSNVDSIKDDAGVIMRDGVLWARVEFYRRLGKARVDTILTTTEISAPTTQAELDRTSAGLLEALLVRWKLMQDLPIVFKDASAADLHQYHQEALTRDLDRPSDVEAILSRLNTQIEEGFAYLDSDADTNPGLTTRVFQPVAGTLLPDPGGSVFWQRQNVWLRTAQNSAGGTYKVFTTEEI